MPPVSFGSCLRVFAAALLSFFASAAAPPAAAAAPASTPATRPAGDFAGEWQTTFGLMKLTRRGEAVQGTYGSDAQESTLAGTLKDKRLTFTYAEPNAKGEGWFELVADGVSFEGQWRESGKVVWRGWAGKRQAATVAAGRFQGLWKTTYGPMRLRQDGKTVQGIYDFAGRATVEGEADGNTLAFHYEQPDGEKGEGTFVAADDGKSFGGTWKSAAGVAGEWAGTHVVPQPGRVWLVVLEAPWETNLEENEYSFGLMLRTYFARVPRVQVRHRFFTTGDEFRRWCDELPYLAEPVVLHVSSHGDKEAVTVGRDRIDGKALAQCLRDAGDLRLVHFGACLVAGGEAPQTIYKALGPAARFPISGYRNAADWAGSAVVDFTYLELVLARGLSPADAAAQTRKMISFARDAESPGDAIGGAGLMVIEPRADQPAAEKPGPEKTRGGAR